MLAKLVLLALSSALAVRAFVVPEGTADGLYLTTYDSTGKTVLSPLADADIESAMLNLETGAFNTTLTESAKFKARGPGSSCGTKYNLNHRDCDGAYEHLKGVCSRGFWVYPNAAVSAVRGSVVTYMCTYDGRGGTCTANDIGFSADRVTDMCGWYVSGYWNKPGTNLNFGRQPSGTCFCHC